MVIALYIDAICKIRNSVNTPPKNIAAVNILSSWNISAVRDMLK